MHGRQPTLRDLLKRWYLLMNQHIDLQLKAQGLARSQFQVLWLVRQSPGLSQKQLVERLGVSEATLSNIVDSVVSKGYISRRPNPADKRSNVLQLTAAGRRKVESIPNPAETVSAHMLRGLSREERLTIEKSLQQIIANLESTTK